MNIFNPTFTFTKRQLGMLSIAGGILGLVGIFFYDSLGMSDPQGGFGPTQKLGLLAAVLLLSIGISLLPLGNDPA